MHEKAFEAWGSPGLLQVQPTAWGIQGSSYPDERQPLPLKHIRNGAPAWLCTIWDSKLSRRHSSCGPKFLCKCKMLRFACANWFSMWKRHNYTSNICNLWSSVASVSNLSRPSRGMKWRLKTHRSPIMGTILPTWWFSEILHYYLTNSKFQMWKRWTDALCLFLFFICWSGSFG